MKLVFLGTAAALLLTCAIAFGGTVPNTLNYQGSLYDGTGQPVTGTKDITISLYDVASGGTPFWTETQPGIVIKSGTFSVALGKDSSKPINRGKLSGTTYIGIKIGSDAEMVPRQEFTSVAYALKSGDGVPIGAIMMWSGTSEQVPDGWVICDGVLRTLPDGSTVTPPNLKDRFVVGAGARFSRLATDDKSVVNLNHAHIVNSHSHGISAVDLNHTHNDDHNHSGNTDNGVSDTAKVEDGSGDTVADEGHSHSFTTNYKSQQGHGITTSWMNQNNVHDHGGATASQAPATSTQLSTATEILPPYFALYFIMKIR